MGPDSASQPIIILVPKSSYVTGMKGSEAKGIYGAIVIHEGDLTVQQLHRLKVDQHRDQIPVVMAYEQNTQTPEEMHAALIQRIGEEEERRSIIIRRGSLPVEPIMPNFQRIHKEAPPQLSKQDRRWRPGKGRR
jgi:hypothetical protein